MLSAAMAFGQTLNDTIAEVTVSGYHVPANISAATPMQVLPECRSRILVEWAA